MCCGNTRKSTIEILLAEEAESIKMSTAEETEADRIHAYYQARAEATKATSQTETTVKKGSGLTAEVSAEATECDAACENTPKMRPFNVHSSTEELTCASCGRDGGTNARMCVFCGTAKA